MIIYVVLSSHRLACIVVQNKVPFLAFWREYPVSDLAVCVV